MDLDIEALPDLDVVILRGNQRDVDEVVRIIQEIERISAETEPTIEVYALKHVSGEALATMIALVNRDLNSGRQGRISVTPLIKPNALLLIGWGEAVESVKELIAKLDQPVAPSRNCACSVCGMRRRPRPRSPSASFSASAGPRPEGGRHGRRPQQFVDRPRRASRYDRSRTSHPTAGHRP